MVVCEIFYSNVWYLKVIQIDVKTQVPLEGVFFLFVVQMYLKFVLYNIPVTIHFITIIFFLN